MLVICTCGGVICANHMYIFNSGDVQSTYGWWGGVICASHMYIFNSGDVQNTYGW